MKKTPKRAVGKRKKIVKVAISLRLEPDFVEEFEEWAREKGMTRNVGITMAMKQFMKSKI